MNNSTQSTRGALAMALVTLAFLAIACGSQEPARTSGGTSAGQDLVAVGQPNGSVQVFWASAGAGPNGQDICAGRMQSSGTLLGATSRMAVALGFAAYPNPAVGELRLRYPPTGSAPAGLRLYDMRGRLMRAFAAPGPDGVLSLRGLAAGVYVLRAELGGQPVSTRVAVAE